MTLARKALVDAALATRYHCVARCVRNARLVWFDTSAQQSVAHRKAWVERRIIQLGEIFACDVLAYVVLYDRYHLIVQMNPTNANTWSNEEIARRWVKLYPTGKIEHDQRKMQAILASELWMARYRYRLSSLSWLMKSISEPIARRANAEDKVNGRFWQGRFKSQALKDERALQAAMIDIDGRRELKTP